MKTNFFYAIELIVVGVLLWFLFNRYGSRTQSFQCGCGTTMSTAAPIKPFKEGIVVAPTIKKKDDEEEQDMLPTEEKFQGGCGCGH